MAFGKSFTHLAPIHGTHIVERNLSVLEPLGITDFYTETTMSYAEDCWKKMRRGIRCTGRERSLCRHPADSQTDI